MGKAVLAVLMVFVGCCSNVVFLELLVTAHPGSGNIITFAQFVVVALEGFINEMRWGQKRNAIPMSYYLLLVVMFFSVNVLNNYALNFHIPLPLHMIFRSGSLIANLILGILLLKKRYSVSKYLAVVCITAGVCLATLASTGPKASSTSMPQASSNASSDQVGEAVAAPASAAAAAPTAAAAAAPAAAPAAAAAAAAVPLFERLIGIGMLTFALFVSALMGIYQESMYAKFGKHPHEALFFVHALSLPAFALMWTNVAEHAKLYQASPPLNVPVISELFAVPSMWAWLFGNVVTQLMCIKGVYILSSEVSSLVCTLVVTLRKFFSLLFSIYYFENPFSFYHWVGTSLVFGGTIVFLDLVNMIRNQYGQQQQQQQQQQQPPKAAMATPPLVVNGVEYGEIKKNE